MSNYFVFRINYDDYFEKIREELICGRLRQGWGAEGMSIDASFEDFKDGWTKKWGNNDADDSTIQRKYNNLCIMKNIKEGDIIVIPKLDITEGKNYPCRSFTVAECVKTYSFSIYGGEKVNDFGHIIGVKVLFSCAYHCDLYEPITVAAKFKAYQKAVNNVNNTDFINAVNSLIQINEKKPISTDVEAKDYSFIVAQAIADKYEEVVLNNLKNLQNLDPKSFEYLIKELFEKNGFICNRMNEYDKEGGDIDIQMMLHEKTLLGSVFKYANNVDNLYINIQAKKKVGHDWESRKAVDQLVAKRETSKLSHYIDIVIDLTDGYDEDTIEYAKKHKVILIDGKQFSLLLLQYGIYDEIDV